jgi:hypothetical protein
LFSFRQLRRRARGQPRCLASRTHSSSRHVSNAAAGAGSGGLCIITIYGNPSTASASGSRSVVGKNLAKRQKLGISTFSQLNLHKGIFRSKCEASVQMRGWPVLGILTGQDGFVGPGEVLASRYSGDGFSVAWRSFSGCGDCFIFLRKGRCNPWRRWRAADTGCFYCGFASLRQRPSAAPPQGVTAPGEAQ